MMRLIFALLILCLIGCSSDTQVNVLGLNSISGVAQTFTSSSALNSVKINCSSVSVYLYRVDTAGIKITPHIAVTPVASDGRYVFSNIRGKIKFENNVPAEPYLIESTGCGKKYSRILTGHEEQDITFGTSLINFTIETDLKDELANTYLKPGLLNNLYRSVNNSTTYGDAYTTINSDSTVTDLFEELFNNSNPIVLQNAPPVIQSVIIPNNIPEGSSQSISVSSFHWSPLYNQAVIWKLGDDVVSNSVTFTYNFGKNIQGSRVLTLYLGQDDGGGSLDLTKPYTIKVFPITVLNTHPVNSPLLSIASSIQDNRNLTLNIDTGAGLLNCETFSSFAITDNNPIPPVFTDFNDSCTTANSQSHSYTLSSAGDGAKVIRMWTMDSSGNISSSPTVLNVVLDENAPVINSTVLNLGNEYTGTPFLNVNLDIIDASEPIEVRLAEADFATGNCQSEYSDNNWLQYTNSITPLSFLTTNFDGVKKICVWAKDSLGHVTVHSPVFGVDGENYDEIIYEVGNVPAVTFFKLSNNTVGANFGTQTYSTGDNVKIEWNSSDVEGLDNDPVSLSYTVDDINWLPIVDDYGGLSGTPVFYNSNYLLFNAPTNDYFKIKIIVKDKSGNYSLPIISNPQNSGNWSVYAGTNDRGAGSSAGSISIAQADMPGLFSVNPLNNDLYFVDRYENLLRMDALTGLTEVFLTHGTTNLGSSGIINPALKVRTQDVKIKITDDGYMYLMDSSGINVSAKIYKIKLSDKSYTRYMPGGNNIDLNTATPGDLEILEGAFAVDESHSLYMLVRCEADNWNLNNDAFKIVKVTQKIDGTTDQIIHFAGNCVRGSVPGDGPFVATTTSIGNHRTPRLTSIAVWDNGNNFYFSSHNQPVIKIINGSLYKTTISAGNAPGMHYNKVTNKLYVAIGNVREYTPDLTGPNGETYTVYAATSGSSNDCLEDGIASANACVTAHYTLDSNAIGTVLFMDGPKANSNRDYRIRYVDNSNEVHTIAGNHPFYGDGKDKSTMRGLFSGIHYKKNTEANQASFPTGLYFLEQRGLVLGHIDPSTHLVNKIFGSQKGQSITYETGDQLSKTSSLGVAYSGGNAMPLAFVNGLPYTKYQNRVLTVDADKKVVKVQNNASFFHDAADGSAANLYGAHVQGGLQNFTFKDSGLFLIGRYKNSSNPIDTPVIKYFDFAANLVTHVMGDTGTVSSPDNNTPGMVKDASIDDICLNNHKCYVQYISSQDRLYFVEGASLRYINNPADNTNSTLGTLFTSSEDIYNFIFKEDLSMVFYSRADGELYCHDISSGKAWCNNTSLGPPAGLDKIKRGPNQFTWADSSTLLISNYDGLIYKYKLLD